MVLETGQSHSFYAVHSGILVDNLRWAECGCQTSATGKREHKENERRVLQRKALFHPRVEQCSVTAARNCLEAWMLMLGQILHRSRDSFDFIMK